MDAISLIIQKHSIAVDLIKKRTEKDIAIDNNVSPNTVERIIDSYYQLDDKVYKNIYQKFYHLMNLNQ